MENIYTIFSGMSNSAFFTLLVIVGDILWIIFMMSLAIHEYQDDYDYRRTEPKCFRDFLKRESNYLFLCGIAIFMTVLYLTLIWLIENRV